MCVDEVLVSDSIRWEINHTNKNSIINELNGYPNLLDDAPHSVFQLARLECPPNSQQYATARNFAAVEMATVAAKDFVIVVAHLEEVLSFSQVSVNARTP